MRWCQDSWSHGRCCDQICGGRKGVREEVGRILRIRWLGRRQLQPGSEQSIPVSATILRAACKCACKRRGHHFIGTHFGENIKKFDLLTYRLENVQKVIHWTQVEVISIFVGGYLSPPPFFFWLTLCRHNYFFHFWKKCLFNCGKSAFIFRIKN